MPDMIVFDFYWNKGNVCFPDTRDLSNRIGDKMKTVHYYPGQIPGC